MIAALALTGLWVETVYATTAIQPDVVFAALVWLMILIVDRPGEWSWGRVALIATLGLAALSFRVAGLPLLPAVALHAWCTDGSREARRRPRARLVPLRRGRVCGVAKRDHVRGAATARPGGYRPRGDGECAAVPVPGPEPVPLSVPLVLVGERPVSRGGLRLRCARSDQVASAPAKQLLPRLCAMLPRNALRHADSARTLPDAACASGTVLRSSWHCNGHLVGSAPNGTPCFRGARSPFVTRRRDDRRGGYPRHRGNQRASPGDDRGPGGTGAVHPPQRSTRQRIGAGPSFINPRVLTWHTGVPAMGFFHAAADTTLAEFRAKRITHVVLGDFNLDPWRSASMAAAVAAYPHAFRRLYQAGVFTVYAFDSAQALH